MSEPVLYTGDDPPKIVKYAGDDWVFNFRYRNKDMEALSLENYTPIAYVTNSLNSTEHVIDMTSGASLLDQTDPETIGKFKIKVSRDITDAFVYPVPANQSFNTIVKEVQVKIRIALVQTEFDTQDTIGIVLIKVKKV